jgi:hypothetical protein
MSLDERCSRWLAAQGRECPRWCDLCGLGPCRLATSNRPSAGAVPLRMNPSEGSLFDLTKLGPGRESDSVPPTDPYVGAVVQKMPDGGFKVLETYEPAPDPRSIITHEMAQDILRAALILASEKQVTLDEVEGIVAEVYAR